MRKEALLLLSVADFRVKILGRQRRCLCNFTCTYVLSHGRERYKEDGHFLKLSGT